MFMHILVHQNIGILLLGSAFIRDEFYKNRPMPKQHT
jgi:hypothetical protein